MPFTLEAVAMHAMERTAGKKVLRSIGAVAPSALTTRTRERFTRYLDVIEDRNEADGKARAAWWTGAKPGYLAKLESCPAPQFDSAAAAAMNELFKLTPETASDGLALFLRARNGSSAFVACVKLELKDIEDLRYSRKTDPRKAIEDVDVENVLPAADKVLKAALIPNPSGASDLRVVDDQLGDPADHWLKFLEAKPRPPEKTITKVTVAALEAGLREKSSYDDRKVAALVAERLDAVAKGKEPVSAKDVASEVAKAANVPAADLWNAATAKEPAVKEPHFELTPRTAMDLQSRYKFPDGIVLSGPKRILDQRVDFKQRDGKWYLELQVPGPVTPQY